jgi:hypothetical protein
LAGIELGSLAYFLGGVFVAAFSYFYVKRKQEFIYYTMMVYWAIFMFFPKIHERYFFAVVAFLPLLYLSSKAIKDYKAVYATASLIFIVNLYHWWWFPELTLLRNTLSLGLVERGLSLASLAVFFKVVKDGYFPKFLFRVSAKAAG